MSKETLNPLLSAQAQVKKACDALEADPAVYELLKEPQRIIEISIPVKMDDGSLKTFKGYRSAHNDAVGPFKGGIRFHQNVNADEVKALSMWMSIKILNVIQNRGWIANRIWYLYIWKLNLKM